MTISRRTFLNTVGAAAAATALGAGFGRVRSAPQVALQLYSIREAMAVDTAAALRRVAAMGYRAVETAFFPEGMTRATAAALLRDAGLHAIACHVEIPVGDHRSAFLDTAEAFDCDRMVWHGWPEDTRYQSLDGIKALADIYNESFVFAKSNGLRFGLHNHWWEMEAISDVGIPYYVLRELIEPEIFFELDMYWTRVAGRDPAKVVADFGDRAPLLHMKDGAVLTEEGPMVALGDGVQDFAAIAEAGRGHTQYMIVELDDCKTDMFDAVAKSYDYLTSSDFAVGGG